MTNDKNIDLLKDKKTCGKEQGTGVNDTGNQPNVEMRENKAKLAGPKAEL